MFMEHPAAVEMMRVMRAVQRVVGAAVSLLMGLTFGAVGLLLGAFVAVALYRVELARDWMVWIVEHVPLGWTITGQQLANDMLQRDSLIWSGVGAVILCLMGWGALNGARRAFDPPGTSDDGWGKLELETEPRLGKALKGRVMLTKPGEPGQVFRLRLLCRRRNSADTKTKTTTLFQQDQDVPVRPGGAYLPFEFAVPATVPASGRESSVNVIEWRLEAYVARKVIAFPSVFDLEVAPQPEAEARALEAAETPQQKAEIDAIARELAELGQPVLPHARARLRELTPAQRAEARDVVEKTGKFASGVKRWAIGCFLVFFAVGGLLFVAANVIMMLH